MLHTPAPASLDEEKAHQDMLEHTAPVQPAGPYLPANKEQARLDRRINLKLDLCVTVLLGLCFLFCGIDKVSAS